MYKKLMFDVECDREDLENFSENEGICYTKLMTTVEPTNLDIIRSNGNTQLIWTCIDSLLENIILVLYEKCIVPACNSFIHDG